ncbi:hypothetical protein GZH47_10175 [Paenibacillus rhizovicinus]|uniref:Uncharacterized protein n=1 Tax=Paenibacillus rhizovicinus TaxID=2704463 RepID=A0A6C0NZ22_9BACL|nr:DUF5696 domain-containing protein [Paenibacillus rhizovicinus]QHW31186.1 hypothetical protein GZH47_10175 [Paenibacillus rhizovicinus]
MLLILSGGETPFDQALANAGIPEPANDHAPLYTGEAWQPAAEADGYAKALENEEYALYYRPDNTQIAVVDKKSGARWTSNPSEAQLANEAVKGTPLQNMQSTFVLTYVMNEGKDQTLEKTVNAVDKTVEKSAVKTDRALQVNYRFPKVGLSLSIQYELTKAGLTARIPTDGIKEEDKYVVYTVSLLPYFGAASSGENGYLLLPDGPGGIVKFDKAHMNLTQGYLNQVYGGEITNDNNYTKTSYSRREQVSYGVFGVKRDDHAFVAILSKGGGSASIAANPPGSKVSTNLFNVGSVMSYREKYLYYRTRNTPPIEDVQPDRLDTDREVQYRFLNGDQANYIGMAGAYRDYLQENDEIRPQLQQTDHIPLLLELEGGSYSSQFNKTKYVAATTFPQAAEIVQGLKDKGVANMTVAYYGWQHLGGKDSYDRFPIEPSLGGASAAKRFIAGAKKLNVPVLFYDDYLNLSTKSSLSASANGIRGIEGITTVYDGWYFSKPARTVDMAYDTINKLKSIGVSGILFEALGDTTFNDYDKKTYLTRQDTNEIYQGLLKYTREKLGQAGVFRGNDYSLKESSMVVNFPHDSSYDFMIDETVPFYPAVAHGFVSYTFDEGNLRNDVKTEFLKEIEYGAIPSFFLTYDETRKLKDTGFNWLYSSQYSQWADRIGEEYRQFDSLAKLYNQKIVGHEETGSNVFATTYEDGTRVVVDYNKGTFVVEGGGSQ